MSEIKDQYSTPGDYSYDGYNIQFDFRAEDPRFDFEAIASQGESVAFVPPGTVTTTDPAGPEWGPGNPFKNDGSPGGWQVNDGPDNLIYGDGDFAVVFPKNDAASHEYVRLEFGPVSTRLAGPIPAGYWHLTREGTTVASFDLAVGSPFYNDDPAQPRVPIPSVEVVVDGSNSVTEIRFRWYYYDPSAGSYVEVQDLDRLAEIAQIDFLAIVDNTGTTGTGGTRIDDYERSTTVYGLDELSREWKFSGDGSDSVAVMESLRMVVSIAGINFNFAWRN